MGEGALLQKGPLPQGNSPKEIPSKGIQKRGISKKGLLSCESSPNGETAGFSVSDVPR